MKLCFPVESDKGLESKVYGHFGTAPVFIVIDTETNTSETINNQDLGHVHGMCNPIKALNGKIVDAVIVGGIGAGAINKLHAMGIKVYRACEGTARDNMDSFKNNTMQEMSIGQICSGHAGGCGH